MVHTKERAYLITQLEAAKYFIEKEKMQPDELINTLHVLIIRDYFQSGGSLWLKQNQF